MKVPLGFGCFRLPLNGSQLCNCPGKDGGFNAKDLFHRRETLPD